MDAAAIAGSQLGAGLKQTRKEQSISSCRNDTELEMNSLILCDKELNSSISLHLRRVSIIEGPMGNLLQLAIEAHGGLERWRRFNVVRANVSITGALWHLKGQPDVLKNVRVVAQLHRQHLVTHLIGKDRRTIFTAGEVSIESESGVVEETRVDPGYLVSRAEPRDPMGHAACGLFCELRAVELHHDSFPLHLSCICQRRDCTLGGG